MWKLIGVVEGDDVFTISTAVTAAASVPSSSTCTNVLWITREINIAASVMPENQPSP